MMAQSSVAEGKHLMLLARVQILAKGLGPQFQINHTDSDSAGNPIKLTTLRINHTGNTLVLSFYEFDAEQIGKVKSKPELFNLYPTPKEVLTITGTSWAWKSLATGKTLSGDGIRPYAALSCKPPKS